MEETRCDINQSTIKNKKGFKRVITLSVLFFLIMFFSINLVLVLKVNDYDDRPYLSHKILGTEEVSRFVFKGNVDNNYIKYSNLLWRILRINSNGSITLILNDSINSLPWSTDEFNIINYLNNEFKSVLDVDKLIINNICEDEITNTDSISCNELTTSIISLLDIHSFIESFDNDKTFIDGDLWLMNGYDVDDKWSTNNYNLSHLSKKKYLNIKPVITISGDVRYESGEGTFDNPYVIETKKLTIGSKVKIKDDYYTVYNIDDFIWLKSDNIISDYKYTGKVDDIYKYLNDNYYNKLTYKEIISEVDWSVTDLYTLQKTNKIKSYVGILGSKDFKVNTPNNTYISSVHGGYILINNSTQLYGTKNNSHDLVPCIALDNKYTSNLINKEGIFEVVDI